jgi:hypothetical protein
MKPRVYCIHPPNENKASESFLRLPLDYAKVFTVRIARTMMRRTFGFGWEPR